VQEKKRLLKNNLIDSKIRLMAVVYIISLAIWKAY